MLLEVEPQLSSRMPAFVVSDDMRSKVDNIVQSTGISRGEIMRRALSLFFAEIANEISNDANAKTVQP